MNEKKTRQTIGIQKIEEDTDDDGDVINDDPAAVMKPK